MIVFATVVAFHWGRSEPMGFAESGVFPKRSICLTLGNRTRPISRKGHTVLGFPGDVDSDVKVNEETLLVGTEVVIDLALGRRHLFGRWCLKSEWEVFTTETKALVLAAAV